MVLFECSLQSSWKPGNLLTSLSKFPSKERLSFSDGLVSTCQKNRAELCQHELLGSAKR